LDVSYCEIRAVGSVGLLLRTTMTSAHLATTGYRNAPISRCGTHSGLCDRLKHSLGLGAANFRFCRDWCGRGAAPGRQY